MSKIFISYRRDDSAAYAGRLYDRLVSHFGRGHVFMDIDQIEPGEVFDQVIKDKLAAVQVAVVLIGERWLDIADASGQRRLDNPDDWVRLEITTLLERNIRVIPVLVGGATMPKPTQLPECMIPLIRRHALEIASHPRFHTDADKLIKALEKIVGALSLETPKIPEKPGKPSYLRFAVIAGVIGITLITGGYLIVMPPKTIPIQPVDTLKPWNGIIEQIGMDGMAVRNKTTPTQALIAEQLQQATPDPVVQPVTEQSKVSVIEPKMVRIPPGKFLMGSPGTELGRESNESPQHEVSIAYAFEIGQYEVTFDEYDAFAKYTQRILPHDQGWGRGRRPVINVSFDDAQAYVRWLSDQTGKSYRLPTEAEWEYAARAGTQTRYWWGDEIGHNNANCDGCRSEWGGKQTAPVGSFEANALGLHDTAGNVWEWMQDCWHDHYDNMPTDGSAWLKKEGGDCARRVARGGSWFNSPLGLRSANRGGDGGWAGELLGFRIARDF
ncbi:MAG: SUMF1/EgtB/PvdO family nonheme iron enzyme [Nitrosomonas sp.]|nr:SUMF1/EgtB/PvdO family nonheme iron enzyme [Nitrosomonas sp.]